MTTPRDDGDIYVPLELQPVIARPEGWRGRSSSFIVVGLVGFLVVAIALGTAFDNGRPAASDPGIAAAPSGTSTPRPTRSPTPRPEPLAPPLPAHAVLGDDPPTERRLVYANGPAYLDIGTGVLSHLPSGIEYGLIALPNGEAICACVVRDFAANGGAGESVLRFGRYDQQATPLLERDLRSFDDTVGVPDMADGFTVATALGDAADVLYVVVVERHPPVWTVELEVVDVETGEVRNHLDVGEVPVDLEDTEPSPSPSSQGFGAVHDGVYLWANGIAAAPDGRTAILSVARSDVRNDNWSSQNLEWLVRIDAGGAASAEPIDAAVALEPDTWCLNQPVFVDPDQIVEVCVRGGDPNPGVPYLRRMHADGTSATDVPIASARVEGAPISIVTDRSSRAVFLWLPQRHVLIRVGIDNGEVTQAGVRAEMLPETPPPGQRSFGRGFISGDPALAISPDGSRLYAIGVGGAIGESSGVPSGVWVFDADRVGLVDHWAPLAFLTSLAVSRDGRFVYAAGAPGVDVDGRENPWPGSVTTYDAETGEIEVVHGAISPDAWISFVVAP